MNTGEIAAAVKKARESAPQRKFKQSFDLAMNLTELDLSKDENKIKEEVVLPNGRGKPVNVAAIMEGESAEKARKAGIEKIIAKTDLAKLAGKKSEAKKLVNNFDYFIASPELMVEVGKTLGPILGPRGKMPKPVPPTVPDLKPFLARLNKLVQLQVKNQPILHCIIGTEEMSDEQIAANAEAVLTAVRKKLPKGDSQLKSAYLKLTMGPSVKLGGEKK